MIDSAGKYEYVNVSNVDVTGAILPRRYHTGVNGNANHGACVMRAEDIAFIFEAYLERRAAMYGESNVEHDIRRSVDLRPTASQYGSLIFSNPLPYSGAPWIDRSVDLANLAWPQNWESLDTPLEWLSDNFGVHSTLNEHEVSSLYDDHVFRFEPLLYLYYDIGRATRLFADSLSTFSMPQQGVSTTRDMDSDGNWRVTTSPYSSSGIFSYFATSKSGRGLTHEYCDEFTAQPVVDAGLSSHLDTVHTFMVVEGSLDGAPPSYRIYHEEAALGAYVFNANRARSVARDFGFAENGNHHIILDFDLFRVLDMAFPAEINSLNWTWTPDLEEDNDN